MIARFKARFALAAVSIMLGLTTTAVAAKPPANLGDLKRQIAAYKNSQHYEHDVAAALQKAQRYLDGHLAGVTRPAIVLDIDETSLSNWPEIRANDYGTITNGPCDLESGPCGNRSWVSTAQADAIQATLALYRDARAKGVSVFFITGRMEFQRAATEANLRKVGYDTWTALIMRPDDTATPSAADYKAPQRAKIEAEGYTIIVNVGDQPSDLAGGHAARSVLVPNPFYRIP
jgi:acid phosphatase